MQEQAGKEYSSETGRSDQRDRGAERVPFPKSGHLVSGAMGSTGVGSWLVIDCFGIAVPVRWWHGAKSSGLRRKIFFFLSRAIGL